MQDPNETTPVRSAEAATVLGIIESMEQLAKTLGPLALDCDRLSGPARRDLLTRLRQILRDIGDECHDGSRTIWDIIHSKKSG
jgi:hypothetical protein